MTVEAITPEKIDAVAHFEATRAAYMNYKRISMIVFWVALLIALTLSVVHTEFLPLIHI